MGVIPRKFFCPPCRKDVWPGDCPHGRLVGEAKVTDLCPDCAKPKRQCSCFDNARLRAEREAASAVVLRVQSIVQCTCAHHVLAYTEGNADEFARCAQCCTKPSVTVRDVIDNVGRAYVGMDVVDDAIRFGLSSDPGRQLIVDDRMPGWLSNGHFLAHVGDYAAASFLEKYSKRDCPMLSVLRGFEEKQGQQTFWAGVNCEGEDGAGLVEMIAWGPSGWCDARPRPALSIVAREYHRILMAPLGYKTVSRESGRDDDPHSAIVGRISNKVYAAIMPRRNETIVW